MGWSLQPKEASQEDLLLKGFLYSGPQGARFKGVVSSTSLPTP